MHDRFRARWLAAAVAVSALAGRAEARYKGDLNAFVGEKWLNNGDWAPVDQQRQYGVMLAFAEERIHVQFSIDAFASSDETNMTDPTFGPQRIKGSSREFSFGVRKPWGDGVVRPHIGAGADVVEVTLETSDSAGIERRSDRGYGLWIDAGLTFRIAKHLNLGLETRYTRADVNLGAGIEVEDIAAGGFHAGILIGYGW